MSASTTNKSAISTPNQTDPTCTMTNQFSRDPQHHSSKFNMESSSSSHQGSSSPLAPAASSSAGRSVSCITYFHNPNSFQLFLCNGICSSSSLADFGTVFLLSSSLSMSGFLTWDHQPPLHTQIPVPPTVVNFNAYTLGFPCYPHPLSMDFPCAPSGCLSLASSSAEFITPWASAFISISLPYSIGTLSSQHLPCSTHNHLFYHPLSLPITKSITQTVPTAQHPLIPPHSQHAIKNRARKLAHPPSHSPTLCPAMVTPVLSRFILHQQPLNHECNRVVNLDIPQRPNAIYAPGPQPDPPLHACVYNTSVACICTTSAASHLCYLRV